MFGGHPPCDRFELETELNLQRAHHDWNSEMAGSNPLWVRTKRMVLRVPYDKSGAALQAE